MPERLLYEGGILALLLTLIGMGSKRQDRIQRKIEGKVPAQECSRVHKLQDERLERIEDGVIRIGERLDQHFDKKSG